MCFSCCIIALVTCYVVGCLGWLFEITSTHVCHCSHACLDVLGVVFFNVVMSSFSLGVLHWLFVGTNVTFSFDKWPDPGYNVKRRRTPATSKSRTGIESVYEHVKVLRKPSPVIMEEREPQAQAAETPEKRKRKNRCSRCLQKDGHNASTCPNLPFISSQGATQVKSDEDS